MKSANEGRRVGRNSRGMRSVSGCRGASKEDGVHESAFHPALHPGRALATEFLAPMGENPPTPDESKGAAFIGTEYCVPEGIVERQFRNVGRIESAYTT